MKNSPLSYIKFFFAVILFIISNNVFSQWAQVGLDIDGESTHDHSGSSVSISNDGLTVAIGAEGNDGGGTNSGHVRVYQYNGTNWVQIGQDINGELSQDFSGDYWSVALNAAGDIVAIGATKNNNSNGSDAGHVRVYQYNGTSWTKIGQDIDGESGNDFSGKSVDLSDDGFTVAIGAYRNDGNGSDAGHARVYQYNGTNWVQIGQDIDGEAAYDYSGCSVGLSADGLTVAIGAYGNDNANGTDAGHARVYQYNGTNWVQIGQDIDGENANDLAGWSVDLSANGQTVIVASRLNDGNGSNSGRARVFSYNGTNWIQKGQSIDGEFANDNCWVVSISDDASTIAYSSKNNSSSTGSVRIYNYTAGSWIQNGLDIDGENSGDYSGYATALSYSGDTVAIGAIYNDGSYTNAGHVRVYSMASPLPIELLSFNADCDKSNRSIQIKWQTATEINNDFYTMEKSIDAQNFKAIGTIKGAGNSNTLINYIYTDDIDINNNFTFYRLKQTDFDGKFTYSNIISVKCSNNLIEIINIYPNPANNYFNYVVYSNEDREIQASVVNILGQTIIEKKISINKGVNNLSLDVSTLASDVYYFKIMTVNKLNKDSKQILINKIND